MKTLYPLILVALTSCATQRSSFQNADAGAYTQSTNWYRTVNGSLHAFDGQDWYELISPAFPVAAGVNTPERWVKLNGNRHQYYVRSLAAYRNPSVQPVFMPR